MAAKKVVRQRLEADLRGAAQRMGEATGTAPTPKLSKERVAALEDALAESAGVPTVVKAVEDSTRLRANRATGWPVVAWFSRLRPDPLKRLHLDLGSSGKELTGRARTSVPGADPRSSGPASTPRCAAWPTTWARTCRGRGRTPSARHRCRARRPQRPARPALGDTDLGAARIPVWAGLVRVLQWLLLLAALGGAAWLGAMFATRYLTFEMPATPDVAGYPLPLLLLVGGIVLGILFALFCRLLVRATARRRARAAERRLRAAISEVADELVVKPVQERAGRLRDHPQGHRPGAAVVAAAPHRVRAPGRASRSRDVRSRQRRLAGRELAADAVRFAGELGSVTRRARRVPDHG